MTDPASNLGLIAEAQAYVQTRFYPPLPIEYGALAVEAVGLCNIGEWQAVVRIPADLHVYPREAVEGANGVYYIDASDLVRVLRLGHLVEDEEAW